MQIIYDNDDKHNNYCCGKTKEKLSPCSSLISEYHIDEETIDKKKVAYHQSDNYDDHLGLSEI